MRAPDLPSATETGAVAATRPRRLGLTMAALCALLPPAAIGGGMLMAPLQALAGLIAGSTVSWRRGGPLATATGLLLMAFALWIALSTAWSAVQRPEQGVKIVGAAATGVVLIAGVAASGGRDRALMRAALAAGLLVLCVYGAVEALFDMPLNRLDEPDTATGILERNPGKGVSILVACLWAGVGALAGRTPWRLGAAGALVASAGALSLQFHMAANVAGFAAGLAGFALGYAAPRIGPMIVTGALAAWVLLAPWLTPLLFAGGGAAMPMSWRMRGEIWRFAAERIAERPVTGWGLDASRQFGDTLLRLDGLDFRAIPLHPHSFSIQIWLEAGAVGALLMAGAIVAAGRAASRFAGTDRACAAAIAGAIAATGLIWNVSYGAWQEWWIATVFCALAFAAAVRRV